MMNKYTTIKYGTHFETKEEALERVYKSLIYSSEPLEFRVRNSYSDRYELELDVVNGKLCAKKNGSKYEFKDCFTGDNWEADEVLVAVEARVVKELNEYRIAEAARKKKEEEETLARIKAEREAEAARKDAEKKAKYNSWKAEAERLGIPFADLCAMKRAEMEENMYGDWDD